MSLLTVLNEFFKKTKIPKEGITESDFIAFCKKQEIDWQEANTSPEEVKAWLFFETINQGESNA